MRRTLALLSTVAVAAVLLLGTGGASPAAAAPGTWLSRINDFRGQNGLGPLAEDRVSSDVAQRWTATMAANDNLAHNTQVGQQVTTPWTRLGENVGYGTDEASLFQAFVNSSGHRANLLGAFNGVGIGQVSSGGRLWTTHVFIETTTNLQPVPPPVWTAAGAGRPQGGMWTATNTGTVAARAGAPHLGQLASPPNEAVVGMAAAPSSWGYWLVAGDGGVFAYGDSGFYGSTGAYHLNRAVVGMAPTPSGRGYWLVASDGGIFAFGDAGFYGSTGGYRLVSPITGLTRSSTGAGYRMVAADGGIFSFGDALYYGNLVGTVQAPVMAITATASGLGYWLVESDNNVAAFGDARAA